MHFLDREQTKRPPAIIAVIATAALTAARPRASAMALKPTWKPETLHYAKCQYKT